MATKLRALLQRDKGRDFVDLAKAVALFDELDAARIVELLGKYLGASGQAISRAEAEERMSAKLEDPSFLADVRPLLAADDADAEAERAAFVTVFTELVKRIPGHAWAETSPCRRTSKCLSWPAPDPMTRPRAPTAFVAPATYEPHSLGSKAFQQLCVKPLWMWEAT
ncbi:nucleotidyl transferase AbiEii/AbiGii toxin family protein [Bradyrhizobium elkanii]|uniref:Nucleotidyl transferase AbiEii/AbiGii toxin family protein n=1 Tax=Bradyrhizobium elkanii TaxID=29448 RepID=A0A4U6RSD9_BRAEL|nr:nucleotidyl transferase AbiEii/AbiGii toxin family protein [Bradyrhizobium elkanii]TKV77754.1 nucleotidyl transferase AbiEii/AbiGii toxin family protein [Bradyrhizobium elkanii]